MAIAIKTTDKADRQDTFRVNPADVAEGRNSRMIASANYLDTVTERAVSIIKHEQFEPVEVRRREDKSLELVYGFTRRDAVIMIREGFDAIDPATGEMAHFHDASRKLWVKVVDVSPDEAFLRGLTENIQRKDTTDLQEALAQSELRTTLGWSDSQIARFYGRKNQNRVSALSKLLTLPKAVQQAVHEGRLALYSALDTLELADDERAKVIDGATGEDGKISGVAIRNLIRILAEKDAHKAVEAPAKPEEGSEEPDEGEGEPEPTPAKRVPKRTVKDLERFQSEEECPAVAAEFFDILLLWFKGKCTDDYLREKCKEYM